MQMLPNLTDLHSQHRPSGRQTLMARNTSIQRGGESTAKKKKKKASVHNRKNMGRHSSEEL